MAIAATGQTDNNPLSGPPAGPAAIAARLVTPAPVRPVVVPLPTPADGALTLAPPPLACSTPTSSPRAVGPRAILAAIIELAKPRITRLVTMTALGGLALSAIGRPWSWPSLALAALGCAAGAWLSSGGANALNQCFEIDRDRRMERTRNRPLPSGRLSPSIAIPASLAMLLAGLIILWASCGLAAMSVAAFTAFIYVAIYTPLKPLTILNTWVGAIPGALPPLIGWAAAAHAADVSSGGLTSWSSLAQPGGWSLFALMAVWQIPHFLALAWLFRDDYARGGYRMLPILDPTGRATVTQIILWSILFLPASMAPWAAMPQRVGVAYAAIALLSGLWYLWETSALIKDRSPQRARRVFLCSVIHLPLLLAALALVGIAGALIH